MANLKKSIITAIGTASLAAEKAEKTLKIIAKKGIITTKEARSIVNKLVKEAKLETKRIDKLLKQELKRSTGRTKPIIGEGKKLAKKVYKGTKKSLKNARKAAQKRGNMIVKKAKDSIR
jgi:polyhydroxyalkanoate synthesis regulator phasin